ncbi:hypothetical protein QJS10_CPB12g00887 [Acorus calamus]|uniref:Uncharacterized protein n=1 Tax=Acorus calamus TaxID=4465 RepID=A0AAV9DQ82_ACOCL|nr:hypothetical protein QJS10_CPB12g00887 [Acorus calamus]
MKDHAKIRSTPHSPRSNGWLLETVSWLIRSLSRSTRDGGCSSGKNQYCASSGVAFFERENRRLNSYMNVGYLNDTERMAVQVMECWKGKE